MIFPSIRVKIIWPISKNSNQYLHSKENKNGSLYLDTLYDIGILSNFFENYEIIEYEIQEYHWKEGRMKVQNSL